MRKQPDEYSSRQYMVEKSFEIFHYKDTYLNPIDYHHHDFYEIYLLLSGNVTYNIEERIYSLHPGDILVIDNKELHRPILGKNKEPYERVVLWINKEYLKSLSTPKTDLTSCFNLVFEDKDNLIRAAHKDNETLREQLFKLYDVCSNSDHYGNDVLAVCTLCELMVLLARIKSVKAAELPTSKISGLIEAIMNYISLNAQNKISLDDIASEFYLSKYHISREFKKYTGCTIYRFATQKRLIYAKELIRQGYSINEVCSLCGFGDYSSFLKAFKKEYGITPRDYYAHIKASKP